MPYYLDNAFLLDNPWITVVGCGGTGGFVAEGLCRLFQGREATIVLVDHDRVEPHNLLRQNFYAGGCRAALRARPSPTGWPGPSTASRRLLGLPLPGGATPAPTGTATRAFPPYGETPCIIGCADNAAARRAMAECLPGDPRRWLIDAGNDTNWGQVLIGNVSGEVSWDEPAFSRRDLLPAARARAPASRSAHGCLDQAARRGLRRRPRPHRPGPDHQPDDGVPGAPGGPPHGGGLLPLHGPLPGHGAGDGHANATSPRRQWSGWWGPTPNWR